MTLASMTGFARVDGVADAASSFSATFSWELKSVNGKGLDLRLRLPPGYDAIEAPAKAQLAQRLSRGNVSVNLAVQAARGAPVVRINEAVLAAVVDALNRIGTRIDAAKPTLDGILAVRGVVDIVEPEESDADRRARDATILAGLDTAIGALIEMRMREGAALGTILEQRLAEIAVLTDRADQLPARRPEAVKAKIALALAQLVEAEQRLDPDRLAQEALLMAAKADIREELDRLHAHISAARELLAQGGPVGRRLDFLAQEFNRETNTLCSKANDVTLTAIGLELKAVVEQFREQVQNLE